MIRTFFADYGNRAAVILAAGLMLVVAHYENQPFISYVFIPQIGTALLVAATLYLIIYQWKLIKENGLGPKSVWIPLAVIAGSAVLRLVVQQDLTTLAGALFMTSMFGLYVVSRQYGEKALNFFMPVTIIGAVSVIIQASITGSGGNAGIFTEYATASQFLVFGWMVSPQKHQWWLSAIVLAGLFATGASEAVFYVAIVGIVILVRRDWSRKILLPVGILAVLLLVCTPLGITQALFERGVTTVEKVYAAVTDESLTLEERDKLLNDATDGRWLVGWRLSRPIQPLGYGFHPTHHYKGIPHNIILLVTDQLGPVAMIAWFGVIIGGIRKTKWKYAFLAMLLFGVFQPFVWTKMAPWLWAMAGAATASNVEISYIFRK